MKYIYKMMGKSSNCAIMLKIHAQIVEKAGNNNNNNNNNSYDIIFFNFCFYS